MHTFLSAFLEFLCDGLAGMQNVTYNYIQLFYTCNLSSCMAWLLFSTLVDERTFSCDIFLYNAYYLYLLP